MSARPTAACVFAFDGEVFIGIAEGDDEWNAVECAAVHAGLPDSIDSSAAWRGAFIREPLGGWRRKPMPCDLSVEGVT